MPNGQILAVIDPRDAHYSLVSPHMDCELIIVDLAAIPQGEEISYCQEDKKSSIYVGGQQLTDVSAIWWRQPIALIGDKLPFEQIPSFLRDYSKAAVERHAKAMGAWFSNALWVSDPYDMMRVDCKPWQLQVAASLGFSVPRTLQTSDPARAATFIAAEQNRTGCCMVKTCSDWAPITPQEDHYLVFWSGKITPESLPRLSGLPRAPAIFQQYIEGEDLRIIVVGAKVFAVKLTNDQGYSGPVCDWRAVGRTVSGNISIEPYTLPAEIERRCADLLQHLGIQYGAIDMRVDCSGVHWFFEINTLGVWFFVEQATGQPIGKAVAHLLMGIGA